MRDRCDGIGMEKNYSGWGGNEVYDCVTVYRRALGGSDRVTPFLTVDFSVGMLLDDELILSGRVDGASSDMWNYTVRPLTNRSQAHRLTILPYNIHSLQVRGNRGSEGQKEIYRGSNMAF